MRRMKQTSLLNKFRSCFCHFFKTLINFLTMRQLVTRVINRLLVSDAFTAVMRSEAEIHSRQRTKMVVGLGNTGMEGTRHSVGMAVLGALASRLNVAERWRGDKHVCGEVIVSQVQHTHVVLLRPRLLMNINGVSVAKAAKKYGVEPENILLVHDELDKPLGKIAVKHGGSARGHNGVRSCVNCLHTDVMQRLRVGIGRPREKMSVERHVLGHFSSEERKLLDSVLVQSVDVLLSLLSQQQDSQSSSSSPVGGRRAAQSTDEDKCSDSTAAAAEL